MSNFNKRVLFVGMPDTAYVTLSALHNANINIVGVVTPTMTSLTFEMYKNFVLSLGYEIIAPLQNINEKSVIEKIKSLNVDIAVVTSYSQKFSEELINTTKDGFVNAHPSLLPEYRGANPYSHVLINNEKYTGLTLHKMDKGFDTGDILYQEKMPVEKYDTMGTLFNKLNTLTGRALSQFLLKYDTYGLPTGINQNTLPRPKYKAYRLVQDSQTTRIDWRKSAEKIANFVRALNPYLPAWTTFNGTNVRVYIAEATKSFRKGFPGQIKSVNDTINVYTGKGVLKIKVLMFGNNFVADALYFKNNIKLSPNSKFE